MPVPGNRSWYYDGLNSNLQRSFLYDNAYQNISVFWHFHKIRKTDSAAFKKFYLCIKCQKHGEYIGKAEASPDTSAYSSAVAELYAYNMAQAFSYGTFRICMKSLMEFQVPQWVIQPITNSLSVSVMVSRPSPEDQWLWLQHGTHFQPHHAAKHTGSPLSGSAHKPVPEILLSHNFLF